MSPDQLVGNTIGGCVILEVLGQGGMGVIYKARQRSLDRVVALKVLAPHLVNDISFVRRFQSEARAIARVNHPNILAVYDVGDDQNVNYMIMELIEGLSLAELQAQRGGPLPWEEGAGYVRQAAQGLEAAQAVGIIHRDIKPENLMITGKGVVKVSDFGLAKEADAGGTSTDAVMGTPAFMSPEQCDGKKLDARSDIYSLGGTFYRLLTGRLPFEAETAMSMMYRHKHEALIPAHEVVPSIPLSISLVINKMMAKRREQRYQNMTEVIDALEAAQRPSTSLPVAEVSALGLRNAPGPEIPIPPPPTPGEEAPIAPPPQRPPSARRSVALAGRLPAILPADEEPFSGHVESTGRMHMPSGVAGRGLPGTPVEEDVYTLVRRGDELLRRGERLGAARLYRQALENPGLDTATRARIQQEVNEEFTTHRQATEDLLKKGLLVEAGREGRLLLELDPQDATARRLLKDVETKLALKRTLINDVRMAMAASDFERAIQIWDAAPAELRDEGLAKQIEQLRTVILPATQLAEQGDHFMKQGRLEEAISSFQDALKLHPTCEPARIGLRDAGQKMQRIEHLLKEGYQYSLDQNWLKTIETLRPILALRANHPQAVKSIVDAHAAQAQTLRAQGDLEGALAAYQGAVEVDPQNRLVRHALEELTNLRDKEAALTERAQNAAARHRLGEAIGYWAEVRRLNPANKRALAFLGQLKGQRRLKGLLAAVVFLVVLAAALLGLQAWSEKRTIEEVKTDLRKKQFKTAQNLLSNKPLWLFRAEQGRLNKEANIGQKMEDAERFAANGKLEQAAFAFEELAGDLRDDPQRAEELSQRALWYRAQNERALGNTDFLAHKWGEARTHFANLQTMLQDQAHLDDKLKGLLAEARSTSAFLLPLMNGLELQNAGRKREAYAEYQAAAQLAGALPPDAAEFVEARVRDMGYDPHLLDDKREIGLQKLAETPPDLAGALRAFQDAEKGAGDGKVQGLRRYTEDLIFCDKDNMALYTADQPLHGSAWGSHERRAAFCIDRYEWPNKNGALPRGGVTWLEAHDFCLSAGKKLCTTARWTNACRGGEMANLYPYGKTVDAAACNTEGQGVLPSGAKPACVNAIGLYDMSGNLAEWTDAAAEGADAAIAGGSYKSRARDANCEDAVLKKKDTADPLIGFRCCKDLPE